MYRGKNIYFRIICSDDLDLIYAWENNPENWKVSSTNKSFTRHQVKQFVESNHDIYIHQQLRLLICLNSTNEVIGNIDLFDFEPEHQRLGVGILIDKKYRKQGFANESIQLIEEYCKLILNIKNIFCNILTDNTASIKLFTKNGFEKIGVKKDWHLYQNNWFNEYLFIKKIQ